MSQTDVSDPIRLSELVAALSYALDLTEGEPFGHAVRTCRIGMRLADEIGLSVEQRSDLFYALLLKDAGCSTNAHLAAHLFQADDRLVKRSLKRIDWTSLTGLSSYGLQVAAHGRPLPERLARLLYLAVAGLPRRRDMFAIRCERGAAIVRQMGFTAGTAEAIANLDEHWDGRGYPLGRRAEEIPLLARVACLSQTIEVFAAVHGVDAALEVVRRRRKRWFDPHLADQVLSWKSDLAFWDDVLRTNNMDAVHDLEPSDRVLFADRSRVEQIARAFADIIDAKSPFTYRHSIRMAEVAAHIAEKLGLDPDTTWHVRIGGLLHDIGKLGVPSTILDKAGPLTQEEFELVRQHPIYSEQILRRVAIFQRMVPLAAFHHERMDGNGYPYGIAMVTQPPEVRLMPVADVWEALTANRPYRKALSNRQALDLMRRQVGTCFCPRCFDALVELVDSDHLPSAEL